jgi:aspartate kinase
MIVLKFGGTSVGGAEAFRNALVLVERAAPRDPIVVVSALSGVTDLLVRFGREPGSREGIAAQVAERHRGHARAVGVPESAVESLLAEWRDEAAAWPPAAGIADDRARDRILGFGERLAAALFAAGLAGCGLAARPLHAGDVGLTTDERFGAALPLPEASAQLRAGLAARPPIPVVTGFVGRTRGGVPTTLGRGGSDYTAALVGAALDAEEIQIWTDTSGMMSADPRIVPEARPVPRLSFAEAAELAYFGAKVLHPKTILPAVERGIPVRVLNTQRPDDAGSVITAATDASEATWRIKSISCKKGITSITIESSRMLMAYGFLAEIFAIFARHHVVVDLVTTSEVSVSLTVDDTTHLDAAVVELEEIGQVTVKRDLAVVAVVGEGAATRLGLAGHLFTLLGGVGIGIEMISQGASRVNLSFVVQQVDADRAVRLLHRGLGLDDPALERGGRASFVSR